VDVVFARNFFEHLPSKEGFLKILQEIRRVVASGRRSLIPQPNIRFLAAKYWDFLDHHILLRTVPWLNRWSWLALTSLECRPRSFPDTIKSRLPQHPLLVRLYLGLLIAHRFLGRPAWVVAAEP